MPLLAVLSLVLTGLRIRKNRPHPAFLYSCATIVLTVFTGLIGLYPNLIPSRLDPEHSLTIFNAASSPDTLKVMTIVAIVFMPIVIAYQAWVYRVFRGKSPGSTY